MPAHLAGELSFFDRYLSQTSQILEEALPAPLGCGNPFALAELKPGETVLDLGSGGGVEVQLSAKRLGQAGQVFGLHVTDEMLALARENQREAGIPYMEVIENKTENPQRPDNTVELILMPCVEFLKGEIEQIPLPDNSVDVIISDCVINLSADKDRVFREAFRVLKPGGRIAVSDMVVRGTVSRKIRRSLAGWVWCMVGALDESEYFGKLTRAGFQIVKMKPTRVYRVADACKLLSTKGIDVNAISPIVDGKFRSVFVGAKKPPPVLRPERSRRDTWSLIAQAFHARRIRDQIGEKQNLLLSDGRKGRQCIAD